MTIRDILDTCKRFAGLTERWRGSGPISAEYSADILEAEEAERSAAVKKIKEVSLLLFSPLTAVN